MSLEGRMLPQLVLDSSDGPVSLRALSLDRLMLFVGTEPDAATAGELERRGWRVAALRPEEPPAEGGSVSVIADPELRLGAALGLPTAEQGGYEPRTLAIEGCAVAKVFDTPEEVLGWLEARHV